jgi:hypothetical protein
VDALLGPAGIGSDDDVWIHHCPHGVPITAPDRIEHFPIEIDVLLRHWLPPLVCEPFGGCAGLVDVWATPHRFQLRGLLRPN